MKPPAWPRMRIVDENGTEQPAIAPLIISASRATDIPAYRTDWFMERFRKGFVEWINPFNGKSTLVAFEKVRVIVFWTKHPAPLFPHLPELHAKGITTLFQLTVNNYEPEGFEPGIPSLEERIAATRALSGTVGTQHCFWRFDPLLLTPTTGPDTLVHRIEYVGDRIADMVGRLTVSFFSPYPTVVRRMRKKGIVPVEPSEKDMEYIGTRLAALGKRWNIPVVSCAEHHNFSRFGIPAGSCIDPLSIGETARHDPHLAAFFPSLTASSLFDETESLRRALKDPGQRARCHCMVSKDIGRYGTCPAGCVYCYAQRTVQSP